MKTIYQIFAIILIVSFISFTFSSCSNTNKLLSQSNIIKSHNNKNIDVVIELDKIS